MDRAHATAASPAARGTEDVRIPFLAETEADRRIEDWIADRFDGGRDRPRAVEWPRSVAVAPHSRRRPDRPGTRAVTGPQQGWKRIRVEQHGDLTVVHLLDAQLLGEAALSELRSELRAIASAGCSRVILSVANVERVSSQFLEILATLDRHCRQIPGGQLILSRVGPELARLLQLSGLDRRFDVATDLGSALNGPWPAGARRLPAELLAELNERSWSDAGADRSDAPFPAIGTEAGTHSTSPCLLVRRAGEHLATLGIPAGGLRIGREAPCEVRARNRAVSRVHAWIGDRDGKIVLEDLGSTNGTIVSGRLIRGEAATILPDSVFRIGPFEFELANSPPVVDAILSEWRLEDEPADPRPTTRDTPSIPPGPTPLAPGTEVHDSAFLEEPIDGVLVLSPTIPSVDDEETLDTLREHLDRIVRRQGQAPKVVINLAPLVSLSGRAIGLIVSHHLRLQRLGGCLRLAQASPAVAMALELVGLPALIETFATIEDAVLSRWPE